MTFKVGDRVKIVKFPEHEIIGDVGVITKVYNSCIYEVKCNKLSRCPMYKDELQLLDQQLLFEFMYE